MAWETELLTASFRGVEFTTKGVDDVLERSIAEHHYAYVNGANIEDLGEKARPMRFHAIFWGDDYEKRLHAFIVVLQQPGSGILVHPIFGARTAMLKTAHIKHSDELRDGVHIELHFVEDLPERPFFASSPFWAADASASAAQAAGEQHANVMEQAMQKLSNGMPVKTLSALNDSFGNQLSSLAKAVQYPLAQITSLGTNVLANVRPFLNDVQSIYQHLGNPLGQAINSAAPTRKIANWLATTNKASTMLDRFSKVADSAANWRSLQAPEQSLIQGVQMAQQAERVIAASSVNDWSASMLGQQIDQPSFTPPQISDIASTARTFLKGAADGLAACYPLTAARPIAEGLRESAYQLQIAANAAINAKPPLTIRLTPTAGNMSLIAHALYGDASRAAELRRLNPQVHPAQMISANTPINAYAS